MLLLSSLAGYREPPTPVHALLPLCHAEYHKSLLICPQSLSNFSEVVRHPNYQPIFEGSIFMTGYSAAALAATTFTYASPKSQFFPT